MNYIDEIDIENKKVLLRCDYNVPMKQGVIEDDSRIKKSLKTIKYLLDKNCSIIILSHLGRIKTREDKINNSLKPVSERLSSLLGKQIKFLNSPVGMEVIQECKGLKSGELIMLENTRFCDYPEKLESNNDLNIAEYWASLADIYVCDAFGSLHRLHASVAGIAKFLPSCYGFLVKEEIENLKPTVEDINKPFGVFMGGAKIDDKLKYIKNILPRCDYLLIGGGIANSFLYACGYDIKDSICTSDEITISELKELYQKYKDKLIMPIDFVIDNDMILDLGEKSINKYISYFEKCKTIFINGTCGKFEDPKYAKGTIQLFNALKDVDAYKVAGGGDTLNMIAQYGLEDAFTFLSSGGGASLEYVSSTHLAVIDYTNKE